jgi:anti-sigma regulatory factor (Ser/Thr protein kinase)
MGAMTERRWQLPRDTTSAREARRRIAEAWTHTPPDRLDDARLLVTELVSNALLHGAGPVGLVLSRARQRVRICVEDESPDLPVVRRASPEGANGRGMRLLASLAVGWGVEPRPDGRPGKRVWFELPE